LYIRWISTLLKRSSPNLKPSAEDSWRAQILDCVTDGLSRRCKAPVVVVTTLCALCQEQFSWSLLERRHALALMKVTPYEVHSLWPLMELVDVLNAILEHFAFWRQSVT
jgi:hypothetical protein